jgi:hypothetical protein
MPAMIPRYFTLTGLFCLLLLWLYSIQVAQARLWDGPQKTSDADGVRTWRPETTAAPTVNVELLKRQIPQDLTGLSTCGYISGDFCE